MNGAVLRYRVMAYVVAVALLLLVGVGVPLRYAGGHPGLEETLGPVHGVLYLVYLATAYDLSRWTGWRLSRKIAVVTAGFVPFLMFWVERRVMRELALLSPHEPTDAD